MSCKVVLGFEKKQEFFQSFTWSDMSMRNEVKIVVHISVCPATRDMLDEDN